VTTVNPNDKNRGFIGVVGINTKTIPKRGRSRAFSSLNWLTQLFMFLGVLSLGIGLFNLLPLGIVDGGRMLQALLNDSFRSKKKSNKIWVSVSLFTLIILLIDLIGPFIKNLL
jgi:membrane-associated protease RseP (regulator of RpoE activity)